MATLVAISLIIVNEDVIGQYNCQVGIFPHSSYQTLTSLTPKVTTSFLLVSMPSNTPPSPKRMSLVRSCLLLLFTFSDLPVPGLLHCVALGRTSNVSFLTRYR